MGNPLTILGYCLAALMIGSGLLLMSGFLALRFSGGTSMRVTFGLVVFLYGVLRLVQTRMKAKQDSDER